MFIKADTGLIKKTGKSKKLIEQNRFLKLSAEIVYKWRRIFVYSFDKIMFKV